MGRAAPKNVGRTRHEAQHEYDGEVSSYVKETPRVISLNGDINEHNISLVIGQVVYLASISNKPINMIISTYGGSVDEMFSLYDVMKLVQCPIYTTALGKVMSAGVLLLSAGTKGYRSIGKNARIMMHPISAALYGTVFEMHHEATELKRMQELMVNSLLKETKMSPEKIKQIMEYGHDYYITPDEALSLGIVDKILP